MDADTRYEENPSQDTILRAISISRRWSIPILYSYALDHFKRQFNSGRIHPAIVLGVAREYGIPNLIRPAIRALAEPDRPLAGWTANPEIIRHMSAIDIGVISRMKDRISNIRAILCTPPPEIHNQQMCLATGRAMCSASWKSFWVSDVIPRLLMTNGEVDGQLMAIRSGIMCARVPGMMERCTEQTIAGAIDKPGWKAESNVVEGAVDLLMVAERVMLAPGDDVTMVEAS